MKYLLVILFFFLARISSFAQDCCINNITERYGIFQSQPYTYSTGAEGYNGQITDLEMTVCRHTHRRLQYLVESAL